MKGKKLLVNLLKIGIGVLCFAIIYFKLRDEFTLEKISFIRQQAFSSKGIYAIVICLLLIPINWGIECYKWKLITEPIENLSYAQASKSVYSGVCLGNLSPGRATEFVGKILFFQKENRPKITALHFIGGMFQLSITISTGLLALIIQINSFTANGNWIIYLTSTIGILILFALFLAIKKLDWILNFFNQKISKQQQIESFKIKFSTKLIFQLFFYSLLRYSVFFLQFVLILIFLNPIHISVELLASIALYFLITTTIPMFSAIEAAIRAAVALFVFKNSGIDNTALALSSLLIWLINIIFPSIVGYFFLLKQKFDFKFLEAKK